MNGRVTIVFDSFFGSGATVTGDFTNGQFNGEGTETFPSGPVERMEGVFNNDQLVQGTITYRNGRVDEGAFTNGLLNGEGRRTYPPDGTTEVGTFANGHITQGTITHFDGIIEVGAFTSGQLNGEGRRTHPDGRVDDGTFVQSGVRCSARCSR